MCKLLSADPKLAAQLKESFIHSPELEQVAAMTPHQIANYAKSAGDGDAQLKENSVRVMQRRNAKKDSPKSEPKKEIESPKKAAQKTGVENPGFKKDAPVMQPH